MTHLRSLPALSAQHDLAEGDPRTETAAPGDAARRPALSAVPATSLPDADAGADDARVEPPGDGYVVEYLDDHEAARLLAALGYGTRAEEDGDALAWSPGYLRSARLAADVGTDTRFQSVQVGLFESTVSPVAAPDLVPVFDAAEGDRIETLVTDGVTTWGNEPVLWRGTADARFRATLGQSVALAGEPGDPAAIHVWTFYDASLDRTVLFVDRNRDFVVGGYDLRLEFTGKVALSPDAFSAGTFFAVIDADGEETGAFVFAFDGEATVTGLGLTTAFHHARREGIDAMPAEANDAVGRSAAGAQPAKGVLDWSRVATWSGRASSELARNMEQRWLSRSTGPS